MTTGPWKSGGQRRSAGVSGRAVMPFAFVQVVEDERSDREETESSEGEEPVVGGKAKNWPLANGHPVLHNNHHKKD